MKNIIRKQKILIGVPTTRSSAYISKTLSHYLTEINHLRDEYPNLSLAICLNGVRDNEYEKTRNTIQLFIKEQDQMKIELLEHDQQSKNEAINIILNYAKKERCDILHLLDDDVQIKLGSISENLSALIAKTKEYECPVLVGSHYLAKSKRLLACQNKKHSLLKVLKEWLLYQIFSLPYRQPTAPPKMCSGQSMAAWVKDFPTLPSNDVADDAYFSNYFVAINRDRIRSQNVQPIVKPENSIIYFDVADNLKEWRAQRLRNMVLISKTAKLFDRDHDFIESFYAWPFSYMRRYRRKPDYKWQLRIIYRIYIWLLNSVEKQTKAFYQNDDTPEWGIAMSTKLIYE